MNGMPQAAASSSHMNIHSKLLSYFHQHRRSFKLCSSEHEIDSDSSRPVVVPAGIELKGTAVHFLTITVPSSFRGGLVVTMESPEAQCTDSECQVTRRWWREVRLVNDEMLRRTRPEGLGKGKQGMARCHEAQVTKG
ncbi:hypothetical protein MHYP_G00249450 [Metynnis hypsauchen]